jgi:cytochrome c oxidase cbb3-type subunit 3/ubiquinol-cytochrome c reductase cytochrome c subunit
MKRCLLVALAILLLGCGHKVEQFVFPDQITDFIALYGSNCAGCHGRDGHLGAARPLNDPVFLALIGKDKLRDVIANGVPKTAMPAFAKNAGGGLTGQQITILANQIDAQWSRPQDFDAVALPSYRANLGDPKAGEAVFHDNCASCHGEEGVGGKVGSVIDMAFLALVSDQSLRTTVIAGRSDRGMPDWRKHSKTMTPQDVSDVVSWLSMHRVTPITLTQRGTKLP